MAKAKETYQETSMRLSHMNVGDMQKKATHDEQRAKCDDFTEDTLNYKEPFGLFKAWYETASSAPGGGDADVMFLATATKDGMPSLQPSQLKSFGTDGLKFHINYDSHKAQELDENPIAAVAFLWRPFHRVVKIEGTVEKISPEDSDECFKNRRYHGPPTTEKEKDLREQHPDKDSKPTGWGGYKIIPKIFDFWPGQSDTLRDKMRFRKLEAGETPNDHLVNVGEGGWVYEKLSP